MYDGNPGEIDFGSSWRDVRVSEGSSYRESTVLVSLPFLYVHCNSTVETPPATTSVLCPCGQFIH